MDETTNKQDLENYKQWLNSLDKLDDLAVSREIYNRVREKGNLDKDTKKLFETAYEYCVKLINQNKPLESNLLKIYLEDINGIQISQINLINLILLLSACGINFSTSK